MNRMLRTLTALLLAAGLVGVATAQSDVEDFPIELTIGMVPSVESQTLVESLEPLAEYLENELLIPVDTFVSTNYVGLVEAIGNQRIDVGLFGPASMVQAIDRYDAKPIVATVRYGASTYKSQFNVKCDGDFQTFESLEGARMAFVDPGSTSGYQYPYAHLLNNYGIDPDEDMTTIFAGGHDASVLAVYNGDVDVAASFDDARSNVEGDFPDVMDEVCVLGYTNDIPNDGAVVRSGLSDEVANIIRQALVELGDTEEGVAIIDELVSGDAFATINSSAYDPVREVQKTFQ
ncbi:MAG: phosphate/phosphite/phosphonate ABC transporter substrate-binding protein [Trueperaceae bacterium]|nr:phosphate/phosphite/phosphonate ABC transporter substrate-binding protein [Trueperaceae bacterium]